MIDFTTLVTGQIDEENLFEDLIDYLSDHEVEISNATYECTTNVENLPKDVQRIIFIRIGTMMIDYAESKGFLK